MVAKTVKLPNIRRFFIPDPGHVIAEYDLTGADAQVVAWEAEDEELKAAFRAGANVHALNAKAMFGDQAGPDGMTKPYYKECKVAVHATNYGGSPKALAMALGWTIKRSEQFQKRWFDIHPGIREWHRRTAQSLMKDRRVVNKFGYHRIYFGHLEGVLPEALAWVPQSTVALNTIYGSLNIFHGVNWCQILLQVHDSIVIQYPIEYETRIGEIEKALHIVTPYDDPLIIPWGKKKSKVSWGDAA